MLPEMFQLKPGLKRGAYRRGSNLPLPVLESLLPQVEPSSIINSNRFPFREAIPVYLMSKSIFKNPSNCQFLLQNTNKLLNKYYESGVRCFKKKKMEALMIKGLRDIIVVYRGKKELTSLQDYWLYKMSDYLISKLINDQSLQFPRLKEFVNVCRYGTPSYLRNSLKKVRNWNETSVGKEADVVKWLKNEYRPALNFIKQSIKNKNIFLQMNMGNASYKKRRHMNLQKMSTLLNLAFDLLGSDLGPEVQMKLEKDQKILKDFNKSHTRKVISFIAKDYPRFNENRVIGSICKKHFKSIYCYSKPSLPQEKSSFKEKEPIKEEAIIKRDNLLIYSSRKKENMRSGKIVQMDKVPYSKIEYDTRKSNLDSKKLFLGHLKFLEDLQNVFGVYAEDLATRKPIEDVLKEDIGNIFDLKILETERIPRETTRDVLGEKVSYEIKPSIDDEDEKEDNQALVEKESIAKGSKMITWDSQLVKKASYIILRFLKNMATMQFLCEDVSEIKTETESSIRTVPSSVIVQLTPMLALKSLLSRKKSKRLLPQTLENLRNNAKELYKRIESKKRSSILDKFKEYNKMYAEASGISSEKEVFHLLKEWDTEVLKEGEVAENIDLKIFSSDSEHSIMSPESQIFEQKGISISNRRTDHAEVLCLLLLFLSVSDKIISVRKNVKSFLETQDNLFKENLQAPKKKYDIIPISLHHFRNFLKKNCVPVDVKTYVSVAQKYCPGYFFFEKKKELKALKMPVPARDSEENIAPAGQEETTAAFRETRASSEETKTIKSHYATGTLNEEESSRSGYMQIVEGQSYLSWKGPPCKKGVNDSYRLYRVKHATEWANYRDVEDFGINKAYISTDFFEYPSTMNIPKLVTPYYRELRTPRMGDSYLLDPTPSSLKWDITQWTKEEAKMTPFEKRDRDLQWMKLYFTVFWVSQGEIIYPWEEVQKLIFDTWCGDNYCMHDETYKYLGALSDAIEEFDKAHRKTRRIYDVKEMRRSLHTERRWYKVNEHLENASILGALGIRLWGSRLTEMYKELDSPTSATSVLSRGSSITGTGSRRHSTSLLDLEISRKSEKLEVPTGFPLRDQKSLNEALEIFIARTKSFHSHRIYIYGKNYKPITEYYLKQLNEECGFVYTDENPEDHPNARFAPPKAIFYSDKEKQFYHHSNNFIDAFQRKYPQRFLRMPYHTKNEYGSMKHICTFISARRLSWGKMDTWKGCMRSVCNKLECTPLDDPSRPPPFLKSPYTTLADRKGNVYELSILLTGFLIAAGYDAYCVCGTATYHRAYYRNTDDVSPDQSDLEGPSTNRYKQYNLLPPFCSTWFRHTAAYKDPIPYEDMEICKLNRRKKTMTVEEVNKWPVTEKELIAEYNKETVVKVNHESRFDNPSISLRKTSGSKETMWKAKSGEIKAMDLSQLYDELVLELMRRNAQDKSTSKSSKTYINEPFVPIGSSFLKVKMKNIKEERVKRRQKEKLVYGDSTEAYEYFDWLYGPNGTHKDFHEIYKTELARLKNKKDFPTVNLLDFLEVYNSTTDRLETTTGQQLYFYNQDSIRCKKKIKRKREIIHTLDKKRLEKLKIKRFQEKMIKQNKILKDNNIYGLPKMQITPQGKKDPSLIRKAHKNRLRQSPFISKMLSKVEEYFPNKELFSKAIDKLGFRLKAREESEEGPSFDNDVNYNLYTERKKKRFAARQVQKSREKKILKKSSYKPSRLHCWVLVRSGSKDVKDPFFIDVFTGCHYPVDDKNYLKISCVWNNINYYIPRYVKTYHAATREFHLENLNIWFHLLPLEPESAAVEKKKKPWWWEAKGHPHLYQHIRMPPYWGRRVRMPALEWDKKFANSNKKTFFYKKTIIEAYDPVGRPTDGLEKRISKFFDMRRQVLKEVSTKFNKRKDRLIWRQIDINSGFTEERFEEGRKDHLKVSRYLAYLRPGLYAPKELQFYGKWRRDKLKHILITKRYLTAEFSEGREDQLKRIKFTYAQQKTKRRFIFLDDHSHYIKRIRARFRKVSAGFEMWKESLPDLFGNIPRKLDINMVHKNSEYWYWDEKLQSEVKWRGNHSVGDLETLMKSENLVENTLLIREPLVYGVAKSLQDTPRLLTIRKEKYAKREQKDRVYLMRIAKELEQIVADTLTLREYEKVKDVLRSTEELKSTNLTSEKELHAMKTYFEVERETLARDFKKIKTTNNIWDLWKCEEDSLAGKLLNYFIKEQFWLFFVLGGWDDMNKMFKEIIKERKGKTPLFSGYTDLLGNLQQAFNQGFRMTDATFPMPPKRNLGISNLQVKVPIEYGLKKFKEIASSFNDKKNEGVTRNGGFTKEQYCLLENKEVGVTAKDGATKKPHKLKEELKEEIATTKDGAAKGQLSITKDAVKEKEGTLKIGSTTKQRILEENTEGGSEIQNGLAKKRSSLKKYQKRSGTTKKQYSRKEDITDGFTTKDGSNKKLCSATNKLNSLYKNKYITTKDGSSRKQNGINEDMEKKVGMKGILKKQHAPYRGSSSSNSHADFPEYGKTNYFCTIDNDNCPQLINLFSQIVKVSYPNQMKDMLNSGKKMKVLGWDKTFIDVFNAFINKMTKTTNKRLKEEQAIMGLVDSQHPFGYEIKELDEFTDILKKLKPTQRFSLVELDNLLTFYEKQNIQGKQVVLDILKKGVKSNDDGFKPTIQDLINADKNEKTFEEKSKHSKKTKKTPVRREELQFAFENDLRYSSNIGLNDSTNEKSGIDYYKLFSGKYRDATKSVEGLQKVLQELEHQPRASLAVKALSCFVPPIDYLELHKGKYILNKKKQECQVRKQLKQQLLAKKFNSKQSAFSEVIRTQFNVNQASKLSSLNLRKHIDIGMIDVINLFSRPSELQFVVKKDNKEVKLRQILEENELKLLDSKTVNELHRIFPIDYYNLRLYEQKLSREGVLHFDKNSRINIMKSNNKGALESSIYNDTNYLQRKPLQKVIKSCPHCINVYFQANKDRIHMLQMVEYLRDDNLAATLARTEEGPLPPSSLELHLRALNTFGDYVSFAEDTSSIYVSYRNKIACDECQQLKYFLDLLNFKVLYDYFEASVLFRKITCKEIPRDIMEVNEIAEPIPYYHGKRPSVGRISLKSLLQESTSFIPLAGITEKSSKPIQDERKILYPKIDASNAVQMELFRDIRERPTDNSIQKKISLVKRITAYTTVTKKIQGKK